MKIGVIAALGSACALAAAGPTAAAEINLHASAAIDAVLDELAPRFEAASGHKILRKLGIASALRTQIEGGADFDVAILVGNLDKLVADGKIVAGTQKALGRSGYGLAVRKGAAKPDIATSDAFKRALLNAKTVSYTEGGGSGAYFVSLLDRLGIAQEMKPKLRGGENTQEQVARGEVEMVVTGIVPILRSPGIELAGPLPPDLQSYSTFTIGVSSTAKAREAAQALHAFLASPESSVVFGKHGVLPAP